MRRRRLRGVSTGYAKPWQLVGLCLLELAGCAATAEVVLRTDAAVVLNRALFIASVILAVFPLSSLLIYLIRVRRAVFPSSRRCFQDSLREGLLVSAVVAANALLRMAAFWSPLAAVFVVALAVMIDVAALSQRWTSPMDPA